MDRRTMLQASTVAALGAAASGCAQATKESRAKPPFVLVHGAFHGGWAWQRVATRLRAEGYTVFTPTLTGMGERAHLIGPQVNLETHIADIVAVIENEELNDVVLVGHSYAGMVVTGVADRINARIARLVYFDAVLAENGKAWADYNTPQVVAQRRADVAARGDGFRWQVEQSPEAYGVSDPADAAWLRRRFSWYPFNAYLQPLVFKNQGTGRIPMTYIDCTTPQFAPINTFRARAKADPRYRVVPLAAGHDGMVNKSRETAEILAGVAREVGA